MEKFIDAKKEIREAAQREDRVKIEYIGSACEEVK